MNDLSSLSSFQWSILTQDLKRTAPLLSAILDKCVNANRCDVRKPNKDAIIAVVGGILLRNCSERVNMVQQIFSVLFYASHVPKEVCLLKTSMLSWYFFVIQVYNRLQKLFLCLSHKRTISVIEELGKKFDNPVKEWRDEIVSNFIQVSILFRYLFYLINYYSVIQRVGRTRLEQPLLVNTVIQLVHNFGRRQSDQLWITLWVSVYLCS